MKKIAIILLIFVFAFWLSSKKEENKNIEIKESNGFYNIEAKYFIDNKDKNNDVKSFVDYVVNQRKEEWKIGGEIHNAEQDLVKKFPDRPKMEYQLFISYSTSTSSKLNTRTYVYSVYEYTGGAHGGTNIATFTFSDKGRVNIEDYLNFENNKDIEIVRILARKLEEVLGDNSDKDTIYEGLGLSYLNKDNTLNKEKCNCDGFFFPSNLQNFVVLDEGVKFIMRQYQVAPYSAGMPEALLTWEELKLYLKVNI